MRNFSCSFGRLYADGGFYGEPDLAGTLVDIDEACRWYANLYPAYGYDRPSPVRLSGRNPGFISELQRSFAQLNHMYARGSSTDVFELHDALLFNRCLYTAHGGEIVQMYETNRPNDRPWRRDLDPAADLSRVQHVRDGTTTFLYLGSIGSENYGHWLIDDLTRARAIVEHFAAGRLPAIVLNSYNPVIDAIREESLRLITRAAGEIEVMFVDYRSAYSFARMYVVSPSSDHPMLKSPQAITFLRDSALDPPGPSHEHSAARSRLFITRRARWRNMTNLETVIAYFRRRDFDIVELEGMSFADQVRTFAHARIVVGSTGAGMANSVFSPPGCTVVHLAPEGWTDPFFWDLAAVSGQRYAALFGPAEIPAAPAFSPFTIDRGQLDTLLADLL